MYRNKSGSSCRSTTYIFRPRRNPAQNPPMLGTPCTKQTRPNKLFASKEYATTVLLAFQSTLLKNSKQLSNRHAALLTLGKTRNTAKGSRFLRATESRCAVCLPCTERSFASPQTTLITRPNSYALVYVYMWSEVGGQPDC